MSEHVDDNDIVEFESETHIPEYRLSDRLYPSQSSSDEFDGDLAELEDELGDDEEFDSFDEYDNFQLGDDNDELM
jgi:hypothetical protein